MASASRQAARGWVARSFGLLALAVSLAAMGAARGEAAMVSRDDLAQARAWAAVALGGAAPPALAGGSLDIVRNFDAVQKRARFGHPLCLAGKRYSRGLFCHAPSEVVVHLPSPGRTFEAIAGVDSNEQTAGGRGSVTFGVQVAGRQAFRSEVQHEGQPPLPVRVSLDGASEFTLAVSDGGDGMGCDQADWANARVVLASGRTVWLDELTLCTGPAVPDARRLPFAFTCGGRPFDPTDGTWVIERAGRPLDRGRSERTITCRQRDAGLVVTLTAIEYADYPTVEWTVRIRNTGPADSPIIRDLQALDMALERGHYGEFTLHHAVGSPCAQNDYQPLTSTLAAATEKRIGAAGGRPTNTDMSYFNLEAPTGNGVIVVVGWPGQWASTWTRDADRGLRVRAGQELTHFRLHPGEEVRTPLIVLQFWSGDWIGAQNVWRRWMLAYNVPKSGGKAPEPELFGCSSHLYGEMCEASDANQKMCIDRYVEERIPIARWWMDAGWYPCDPVGWPKTGTWEVDTRRFPGGLRSISDHAHSKGIKTIVWFEPERVHPDTWITKTHPEWVLGGAQGGLLNLGNPEARKWLTDHVDRLITEQGIDLYRQDFNMDPLPAWRAADAPDRQGITEMRHVEGYLAYWDELQRRHPGMLIDSCASGGRRNDLETMRRAIPLWRTDWRCEPVGTQACTYGISLWIPLSGTGAADVDAYTFQSNMTPFTNLLLDIRNRGLDYRLLRSLVARWRKVAACYAGDYYPLTEYSLGRDTWMAWQFNLPEAGEGMVQAFRRDRCIFETGRLKLRGLEASAMYAVADLEHGTEVRRTGRTLMERGLLAAIDAEPGAALYHYRKVR